MKIGTIKSGTWFSYHQHGTGTHTFKAHLQGKSIVVQDENGNEVNVQYAATSDKRTCYAHVEGIGFIGGWQWPNQPKPFQTLVAYINQGILYHNLDDLPTSGGRGSHGPREKQ